MLTSHESAAIVQVKGRACVSAALLVGKVNAAHVISGLQHMPNLKFTGNQVSLLCFPDLIRPVFCPSC